MRDVETYLADADTMRVWGEWLGARREELGLSKRKVAERVGVADITWRNYEGGGRDLYGTWVPANPDDATLYRIAKALEVKPEEVFERAGRQFTGQPSTAQPAAASGDPSHLTGIMTDLASAVRDLRDEVRMLRQQRGGSSDVEPMEGGEPGS